MVYKTRRLNAKFTRVFQKSLSLFESIKFLVLTRVSSRSILVLSFHIRLGFPRGLFPVGLPVKILKALLSFKSND